MRFFLCVFFALALTSCSQGPGNSSANLRITGGILAGNYHGMIYGRHGSGKSFAKKLDGAATQVSINLPNGSWEFAVISWDNADPNPYEGGAKCYTGNAVLDGSPVSLNAVMTDTGCSANILGGTETTLTNSGAGLKSLTFYNCLGDVTGVSAYNEGCNGFRSGFNRSFTLALAEYNDFGGTATAAYVSQCIDASTFNSPRPTDIRIPIGDANSIFRLIVTAYDRPSCTGISTVSSVPRGLQDPESKLFKDQSAAQYVYFDDQGVDKITPQSSNNYGTGLALPYTPKFQLGSKYAYLEGANHDQLFSTDLSEGGASYVLGAGSYTTNNLTLDGSTLYFTANVSPADEFDLYSLTATGLTPLVTATPAGATPPYGVMSKVWKVGSLLYYTKTVDDGGTTKWQVHSYNLLNTTETPIGPMVLPNTVHILGAISSKLYFVADDGSRKLYEVTGSSETDISGSVTPSMPGFINTNVHYSLVRGNKLFAFVESSPTDDSYLLIIPSSGPPEAQTDTEILNLANITDKYPLKTSDGKRWFVRKVSGLGEVPANIDSNGNFTTLIPGAPAFSGANGVVLIGNLNGKFLFYADADASVGHYIDLYEYDGSTVTRFLDSASGLQNTSDKFLLTENLLYFAYNDGTNGTEPWKYDGSAAPSMITNINPSAASSDPSNFTEALGKVFFSASDPTTGFELWKTDGTPGGTAQVADVFSGSGNAYPDRLTASENYLYFIADGGGATNKFFRTDGTSSGTQPVFGFTTSPSFSKSFAWEDRMHVQLWDFSTTSLHHFFITPD